MDPQHVADPSRWADPAQPVLTFYDDATGERVEFSARTLGNWVAKTANLGVDLLDLEPGDTVAIDLPVHWLGVVWTLAAMSAGWRIQPAGSSGTGIPASEPAAEVLVTAAVPEHAFDTYRDVVAVSTRPLALAYGPGLPTGVLDYAAEVPANADVFHPGPAPAGFAEPWWTAALAAVAADGHAGDRLLTGLAPTSGDGLVHTVLVPAIATGSVVLVAGLEALPPGRADAIASTERVTRRH
jgi:uncharacterized protein (TIGR03089 family)